MNAARINRLSRIALTVLSLIALLDVLLVGYTHAPLADEGTGAHIFQLSMLAVAAFGAPFLVTADWASPVRVAQRLAVPAVAVGLAFAALYFLEHYFYPAYYLAPHR